MLTDEQIFEIADPFGAFEYGDAQGDKRRGFALAIERAAIEAFLARTGKYLTNDASREAAIADATAPLLAQIAELEAQLLEAKKDAERYRWLKNDCNDKQTTGTYIAKELFGFEWDRAIDAAIAKESEK